MKTSITEQRIQRIRDVLSKRQKDLTLILNNIHDPHNVSAILRSCDAFGVHGVHLYYTRESFPLVGKRSSASAKKWVDRIRHHDAATMINGLRGQGYQIIGTNLTATARPLPDWDFTGPTAILLGNEHRGQDPALDALIPDNLFIPMQGMIQSLNVSVAAAVILYEAWRQRHSRGCYDSPRFNHEEMEAQVSAWMLR
ncbi:TrmH family RNA methyltransferase [Desulfonatronum thioautotrophicum]|uniref:TrmH family RNA methyltransferase n=1 Tax=Desulfonatronum thioautotrophicum TaxID=617001 RepID=UPI0005EBD05E|nr:RNA methyltransferase [Desulfonatronum thioautotrophicum]